MARLTIIIAWFVLTGGAFAQDSDEADPLHELLTRQQQCEKCVSYHRNAAGLAPGYYDAGHFDSILIVLEYWETECGKDEAMTKLRDMIGLLRPDLYPPPGSTMAQDKVVRYIREWQPFRRDYFPFSLLTYQVVCEVGFDDLVARMAQDADSTTSPGSYEHLLCLMYQRDDNRLLDEIQSTSYAGAQVQKEYYRKVEEVHATYGCPRRHYSFQTGVWIPHGRNELLGSHAALSATYGVVINGWQVDGNFGFRFLRSRHDYLVKHEGSLTSTHTFQSLYLGLDMGHRLFGWGNLEFDGLGGFGYDGLTAVTADDDEDNATWLNSLNVNVGGRLKYYFSSYRTAYVGLDARYNWLDWDTDGGTDLTGNAVTVMLTFGFYPKPFYKAALEALRATPDKKPLPEPEDVRMASTGN